MPDPTKAATIRIDMLRTNPVIDLANPPSPLPAPAHGGNPLCSPGYFTPFWMASGWGTTDPYIVKVSADGAVSVKQATYIDFIFTDATDHARPIRPIGIAFNYTGDPETGITNQTAELNMPVGEIRFFAKDQNPNWGGRQQDFGATIRVLNTLATVSSDGKKVKWSYNIFCENMENGEIYMIDPEVENDAT